MREANEPVPLFSSCCADLDGGAPVARALVQVEQRQARLGVEARAVERLVGVFGAVEEAGLHEVLRQRVLGTIALACGQVGAAEQMLVHAHRALVFAAAAEQVAEREVQVGGVGVLLDGLDEGVDRLVVLLVEQQIQALVVDLGRIASARAAIAACRSARRASRGCSRPRRPAAPRSATAAQSPSRGGCVSGRARRRATRSPSLRPGRDRPRRFAARDAPVPPPARHHREDAEGTAEAEGREHDEDHRRAPLLAEEPVDARLVLVVQREGEEREEDGGPDQPDE